MSKNIYRGREIKFYDYLMSKKDGLLADFLSAHPDFTSDFPLQNPEKFHNTLTARHGTSKDGTNAWKLRPLRSAYQKDITNDEATALYPTAKSILDHFDLNHLNTVSYSILEANSIIHRHTGPENREAKFVRIHVPLLVPEGEMGMEVAGEEINWDDLFGFNNQIVHSVYNYVNKRRLVFMIDISRELLELPDVEPWSEKLNAGIPPFPKTERTTPVPETERSVRLPTNSYTRSR